MQTTIDVLCEGGVILKDAEPMRAGQYDFRGGVPVIDIDKNPRPDLGYDFMLYDTVTSPDGRTLIQGVGTQYAFVIREGEPRVVDRRPTNEKPFGVIGRYPAEYFLASRDFVESLEERCK